MNEEAVRDLDGVHRTLLEAFRKRAAHPDARQRAGLGTITQAMLLSADELAASSSAPQVEAPLALGRIRGILYKNFNEALRDYKASCDGDGMMALGTLGSAIVAVERRIRLAGAGTAAP